MNGNQLALRPLRHFADFRGRSSRGELCYFLLLLIFLGFPVAAIDAALGRVSGGWAAAAITALLACPFLALCVRRLHDVGWRGWWILPLLPAMGIGWWNGLQHLLHPLVYPPPRLRFPPFAELVIAGCALAVVILLFWDDDEAPNRYGANPRTGPEGEPA